MGYEQHTGTRKPETYKVTDRTYCSPPQRCDGCGTGIGTTEGDTFYDAVVAGRWGNFCPMCFKLGLGSLGTGRGQMYVYQPDGKAHKVIPSAG
jgi:hypothetical protein